MNKRSSYVQRRDNSMRWSDEREFATIGRRIRPIADILSRRILAVSMGRLDKLESGVSWGAVLASSSPGPRKSSTARGLCDLMKPAYGKHEGNPSGRCDDESILIDAAEVLVNAQIVCM